ncbi:MAG: recombination regulator RecX [Actinobacteria bacterium]|nr:recombination regulator RecX [Actinomycetota bacterium]
MSTTDPTSAATTADADADAVREAVAFVLASTRRRPQTRAELAGKLRSRGVPQPAADAALSTAGSLGAIDDEAFARAWVRDRGLARGYGVARLRLELRRRLVPDHVAEDALRALGDRDECATVTALARERAGRLDPSLPPDVVARRLAAYLVRRGHGPALSQRVSMQVSGADREWD